MRTDRPLPAAFRTASIMIALMLALVGCARNQPAIPEARLGKSPSDFGRPGYGADRQYGNRNSVDRGNSGVSAAGRGLAAAGTDIVYFSSDSAELTPEARSELAQQANWLGRNRSQSITIEGHADERGTREYNLALGARRAEAVKRFLIEHGIDGTRVRTSTYGKERPLAVCDDISCWSQNRRAQTVIARTVDNRY